MNAIDTARARIDAADGLGSVFGAAWDAFELIRLVAHDYSRQVTDEYAMWMYAIPPACEGRDVLGFAPSTPEGPGLIVRPGDLDGVTEDQAADMLSELASTAVAKLRTTRQHKMGSKDAAAQARAVQAAEEIRDLLTLDGA